MKRIILSIIVCTTFFPGSWAANTDNKPSDPQSTARACTLYNRLFRLMDKGIMMGHQDALAYGHQNYQPGASDVKEVTGDYPAVIGWEIGHLELGADRSLDSVYFDKMREQIIATDARGGINTISWHADNIITGGSTWDCKGNDVVRSLLPGQAKHEQFSQWLDRLAVFFNTLKDKKGELIPIVFRLYHEHSSSWFWWGNEQCSPKEYIEMWRMTVNHLRNAGVNQLLYAYSPSACADEVAYTERYPGNEYVDVVGFDLYHYGNDEAALQAYCQQMHHNTKLVTKFAQAAGKVPTLSETGWEGVGQADYFTKVIYPLLEPYQVSWILFWRNAWEPDKLNHFYLPYKGQMAAKDFKKMVSQPRMLMNRDIN